MSITISNCDEICKSPTNNSPSKMLYTFPKTTRFHTRNAPICDKYYDIPSSINSCRTTSQGFGHKYDFTQNAPRNPPPNTYNIKSTFLLNKTQGFGFGKGRQQMEATGPLALVKSNRNPGPGTYQSQSPNQKMGYTMTGKFHEEQRQKLKIPGPGYYPMTFCINEKGTYFLSKYKNSCVTNFSKLELKESASTSKLPGPGAYDTRTIDLSPKGRYVISKMKNCLTRKFAITTRRPLAQKNQNPGPGNYKLPSEFGYYLAKNASQKIDRGESKMKEKTMQSETKEN